MPLLKDNEKYVPSYKMQTMEVSSFYDSLKIRDLIVAIMSIFAPVLNISPFLSEKE